MSKQIIPPDASLDEIFEIAIQREAEANKFYTSAATKMQTREARELLLRLAREELDHEIQLTKQLNIIRSMRDVERAMASDM